MIEMEKFKRTLQLSDQVINIASKEDLAECARLLAINIAHYESVFGALPLDDTLEMAYSEQPNQDQINLITKGMETLLGVLSGIVQGFEQKSAH